MKEFTTKITELTTKREIPVRVRVCNSGWGVMYDMSGLYYDSLSPELTRQLLAEHEANENATGPEQNRGGWSSMYRGDLGRAVRGYVPTKDEDEGDPD